MLQRGEISAWKQAEEHHHQLEALLHEAQKVEATTRLSGGEVYDLNILLPPILNHQIKIKSAKGVQK
jgi:hypothetical protein